MLRQSHLLLTYLVSFYVRRTALLIAKLNGINSLGN